MAKVPKAVRDAFKTAPRNNTRGTANWLLTQSDKLQKEFEATIRAYLKGRADGTITLSLDKLVPVLKQEFSYPFRWGALRSYMSRHHADLFDAQVLGR